MANSSLRSQYTKREMPRQAIISPSPAIGSDFLHKIFTKLNPTVERKVTEKTSIGIMDNRPKLTVIIHEFPANDVGATLALEGQAIASNFCENLFNGHDSFPSPFYYPI